MSLLAALVALALLAAVIAVVSAPLRSERRREDEDPSARRGELEAAREAKYREVRDAELDYRTGKLSDEDYERVAHALRAEALEILDRLEALASEEDGAGGPPPPG